MIQHRRQRQPTRRRNPVGEQTIKELARPGARELVFRVAGDLHEADPRAHRRDLLGHHLEGVRPAEGRRLERLSARTLEPERLLETVGGPEDRVAIAQALVQRRGQMRARRGQLLVGEGDREPTPVVLTHLGVRVDRRRPVAESSVIHPPHVEARIAVRDPVRHGETDPASLTETGHHPTGQPVTGLRADRPDERVAVGGEGERAVDRLADTDLVEDREMREADVEALGDPLQVGGEQLRLEVPRGRPRRPGHPTLLVGAEQQAVPLLAHVDLAAEVDDVEADHLG